MPMPRPSVKTFDDSALQQAAFELEALVRKNFTPDIVIGIRTGGERVARHMGITQQFSISCQRPGTAKKKCITPFLRILPYSITNQLRRAEHALLARRTPATAIATGALPALPPGSRILIVDDAVDSGATLAAALEYVRKAVDSSCIIRTAAITLTTITPLVEPDYTLYRYVLCRFPWSFDYRR